MCGCISEIIYQHLFAASEGFPQKFAQMNVLLKVAGIIMDQSIGLHLRWRHSRLNSLHLVCASFIDNVFFGCQGATAHGVIRKLPPESAVCSCHPLPFFVCARACRVFCLVLFVPWPSPHLCGALIFSQSGFRRLCIPK